MAQVAKVQSIKASWLDLVGATPRGDALVIQSTIPNSQGKKMEEKQNWANSDDESEPAMNSTFRICSKCRQASLTPGLQNAAA